MTRRPSQSRPRRAFRLIVPWVMAIALMVAFSESFGEQHALAAGGTAPQVRMTLSDGSQFNLDDYRGKVVVLNFWGSFCAPCRHEAPVLTRAHRQLEAQGGMVVGLSVDRQPHTPAGRQAVGRSARAMGMDFPVGLAPMDVVQQFGVRALPTTVVIDREGRVAEAHVGMVDDAWVQNVLARAR